MFVIPAYKAIMVLQTRAVLCTSPILLHAVPYNVKENYAPVLSRTCEFNWQ